MEIIVLIKMVPDTVEELSIDASGKKLDDQWLRLIPNELDEHALEEALILKEKYGGTVTVYAIDAMDIDNALFASIAKGADKAIKIKRNIDTLNILTETDIFQSILKGKKFDVIITGVQANDDLDGNLGSFLASELNIPYLGVTTNIEFDNNSKQFIVRKAFAGGLQGEFEVPSPALLGVQSAEKPPRYVPIAKIRKAKKGAAIEEIDSGISELKSNVEILQMIPPKLTKSVEYINGSSEEIAGKICDILVKEGVL
ncbi:MAG: electron transfer flavoprotein subunit beta/FixA family protein [Candidatus Thorarchaeota archaeon]